MAFRFIRRKIDHLRQQPEDVRLRAATLMTAGVGAILVVAWLAILLPLQISLNNNDSSEDAPIERATQPEQEPALALPSQALRPDVAGVATTSPTRAPLLPSEAFTTPLISPSPSSSPAGQLPTAP